MQKKLKSLFAFLAALLCGAVLTLAFAPFEIFPAAVLSFAGLSALLLKANARTAGSRGFGFGLGLFGTGVYWVFISISRYGDVSPPLSALITLGLVAILALFPAAACYFTNQYFTRFDRSRLVFAFPAIWVFSEWLRSWLFSGFPWLLAGYSQTNSPLKGYAPILSVYAVSLAVVMTGGLLVNSLIEFRKKSYQSGYLNLFAMLCLWTGGALLSLILWTHPIGKPISVSLVQGDIPQSIKWSPEMVQLSLDRYAALTKPHWGKSRLIIWPEAAIPLPFDDATSYLAAMDINARKTGSQLILGIPIRSSDGDGFLNAVITLGQYRAVYNKRLLVPFGEYIPFKKYIARALDFMNVPMSDMVPGKSDQGPLKLGHLKIETSICYEIAFPEWSRTTDRDVNLLLTVTNDAWFGKSTAQAQHLQMAAMRSIELGRPLLFVSNNGITAVIGPTGLIEAAAPDHVPYVLTSLVQPAEGLTPWMRFGMTPLLILLIALLLAAKFSENDWQSMVTKRYYKEKKR